MKIQHHVKYKEIHGEDEIVLMERRDHWRLHKRLRKEGTCKISVANLVAISTKAHNRTPHRKEYCKNRKRIRFAMAVYPGVFVIEEIALTAGYINVASWYEGKIQGNQ